ncbi:MAG: START domain-containing protein, partial [Acinetobacter towneri]
MKKSLLMLGLSTCICVASAQNIEHAKLSIHKNNINVWTFQQQSSPVFLYKAETTFNVPLEKAAALILDVDHAVKWVPYVGSVKVLSRDDQKGEFLLYMVLDFPFPLKDRDLVVKGKMSKDAQGMVSIQNKAIEGGYPLNPNYVRIQNYEGDWTFKKLGNQKV